MHMIFLRKGTLSHPWLRMQGVRFFVFGSQHKTKQTIGARHPYFLISLEILLRSQIFLGICFILFTYSIARADQVFLEPEIAFPFSAQMEGDRDVAITYQIAPGYYLYRECFKFHIDQGTIGKIKFPAGTQHFDENFQKTLEIYRGRLTLLVPVEKGTSFTLTVTSQGCADKGLCYPPQTHTFSSTPNVLRALRELPIKVPDTFVHETAQSSNAAVQPSTPISEAEEITNTLHGGKLSLIVPLFLILGLGLSFTPCVLPMVPILSSLIVGQGHAISRGRGLALSAVYSLGMALVYTLLGVAAGLIGEGMSAYLQSPYVLSAFSLLMVAFALPMFDLYTFQMPNFIQGRLGSSSNKQSAGNLVGVFVMGVFSGLIIGPCVAAPLAGTLVFISQTHDVFLGGAALFAMALGMSVPLLLVGFSAGHFLPRAGQWMDQVKRFFGVLMLGVALWQIMPILPFGVSLGLWGAVLAGYGMYLFSCHTFWVPRFFALICLVAGVFQWVGMVSGAHDPLYPLGKFRGSSTSGHAIFERVSSLDQLKSKIAQSQKPVLLDFYADWCIACKEMEHETFSDSRVRENMEQFKLLQVDVTDNDIKARMILKHFRLYGPPGIIFFDNQGQELPDMRVVGFKSPEQLLSSLLKVQQEIKTHAMRNN